MALAPALKSQANDTALSWTVARQSDKNPQLSIPLVLFPIARSSSRTQIPCALHGHRESEASSRPSFLHVPNWCHVRRSLTDCRKLHCSNSLGWYCNQRTLHLIMHHEKHPYSIMHHRITKNAHGIRNSGKNRRFLETLGPPRRPKRFVMCYLVTY